MNILEVGCGPELFATQWKDGCPFQNIRIGSDSVLIKYASEKSDYWAANAISSSGMPLIFSFQIILSTRLFSYRDRTCGDNQFLSEQYRGLNPAGFSPYFPYAPVFL